ncbi:MAG: hypothetical protein GY811_15715 [Myxococcales bacterium]|nr:hypothetical protein [Myxococcales bacterium]
MLQHSLFGKSSERRGGDDPTSSTDATPEQPDSPSTGASEGSLSSDKKSDKKNRQLDLPTLEKRHALADDDQACDHCGGQLVEWEVQLEEFEEIDVVERIYRIAKHRRQKCRCAWRMRTGNSARSNSLARQRFLSSLFHHRLRRQVGHASSSCSSVWGNGGTWLPHPRCSTLATSRVVGVNARTHA